MRFRAVSVLAVVVVSGLLPVEDVGFGGSPAQAQTTELCDTASVTQFTDVEAADYAASYILCMRALELSRGFGDGDYGANRELTRGQMASFLVRLWRDTLDNDCPKGDTPFTDTPADGAHTADIECLYNLGITKGTTPTTYGPTEPLKASQISRFLLRTYQQADHTCPTTGGDNELDQAVNCLTELRVIPNTTEGAGTDTVNRAQMAVYVIGLWHNLTNRGLPPTPPTKPTTQPPPSDDEDSAVDPLGLIGDYHYTAALGLTPDIWQVDICQTPLTQLSISPEAAIDQAVALLNAEASPYFTWLSDGRYQVEYRPGRVSMESNAQDCLDAGSRDKARLTDDVRGVAILTFIEGTDPETPEAGRGGPGYWPGSRIGSTSGRKMILHYFDLNELFLRLVAHEQGHALAFPHPTPNSGYDIMAYGVGIAGTNVVNRYSAGWVDPQLVETYGGQAARYMVHALGARGTQMVVIPTSHDKNMSVVLGARIKSGYDQWDIEGIEMTYVLDPRVGGDRYSFKQTQGPALMKEGFYPGDLLEVGEMAGIFPTIGSDGVVISVVDRSTNSFVVDVVTRSVAQPSDHKWIAVSVHAHHLCAVNTKGQIYCWGVSDRAVSVNEHLLNGTGADFIDVSVGEGMVCGLHRNGTIVCWQIGAGGPVDPPSGRFKSVSVADIRGGFGSIACGIRMNDTISCWGDKIRYNLTGSYKYVSAGNPESCAVLLNGELECWVPSLSDNIWRPDFDFFDNDILNADGDEYRSVSVTGSSVCGVTTDGRVRCWYATEDRKREERFLHYNLGTTGTAMPPLAWSTVVQSPFNERYCGLSVSGSVRCWGWIKPDEREAWTPPSATYDSVAMTEDYACGILSGGYLTCWGEVYAQIEPPVDAVLTAESEIKWKSITGYGASYTSCGITTVGNAVCWGQGFETASLPDGMPQGPWKKIVGHGSLVCGILLNGTASCWGHEVDIYGVSEVPDGIYKDIALGSTLFACGVTTGGDARCWGTDVHEDGVLDVPPGGDWKLISAGGGSLVCGIRGAGTAVCWGDLRYLGSMDQVLVLDGMYESIAVTDHYVCAILIDGTGECWGDHSSNRATDIPTDRTWKMLSLGGRFACGITGNGEAVCWGDNSGGQLNVPTGGKWVFISAGMVNTPCGVRADGTGVCWGSNSRMLPEWLLFQADPTKTVTSTTPTEPDSTFTAITAGRRHSCAIRTDQTITCWGSNEEGQATAPEGKYTTITAGHSHSCAIRTDQTITCWGANRSGQADAPDGKYTTITAGGYHSCAIRTDQTITCWGSNELGQATAPEGKYTAITARFQHSCAIRTNQTITCWGYNEEGQATALDGKYTTITAGGYHSCAIRTDGTATCWGRDSEGQTTAPEGTFTTITAGSQHSCAIRTDQTITCWGRDSEGQTTAPEGTFTTITAGGHHSCAIRTDRTITCWGYNYYGQTTVP